MCGDGKGEDVHWANKPEIDRTSFRIVSEKKSGKSIDKIDLRPQVPPSNLHSPSKRPRKAESANHPSRLPIETNHHSVDHVIEARDGIAKNGQCTPLDGSYYCIHCGKVNDLLRTGLRLLMQMRLLKLFRPPRLHL